MLTDIYIEALPVDEHLADQVWGGWSRRSVDDLTLFWLWMRIADLSVEWAKNNSQTNIT